MDRAPHAFFVAAWGGHQTRNRTGHGRYTAVGLGTRLRKTPQRPPYVLGSVKVWNTPDVWPYESVRLARMGLPTRGSSFPPVRRLKESSEDGSTALTPDTGNSSSREDYCARGSWCEDATHAGVDLDVDVKTNRWRPALSSLSAFGPPRNVPTGSPPRS